QVCRPLCSLCDCDQGRCVLNNASSYMCICAHGWSGQNCRINVNDCVQHWCQNGATCVDEIDAVTFTALPLGLREIFYCLCPSGYTGVYCEQDIDYCVDSRCSEHGVCLDQRYNFTCRCMLGYEGPLCDVEANECNSFPCSNGATCEDLISDYRCHCPPGFEGYGGAFCEVNLNECESKPCQNGGICVDDLDQYRCLCSEGKFQEMYKKKKKNLIQQTVLLVFTDIHAPTPMLFFFFSGFGGFNCEINRDECVHGYCANNSTCIDLVADYECICPSGFGGEHKETAYSTSLSSLILPFSGYSGGDCSSSVNQCVSNPCDPEGTILCEELKSTYRCVCHHGNTGTHCETPINHCVDGLCQHGSVCVDLSRGFKCDCLPGGFTLQLKQSLYALCKSGLSSSGWCLCFCEINNDDCELDPCGLLSICKDSLNGYNCFCAPGFIGNNCEIEVNECLSHPCENGGSCIDELNSFSCDCPAGITGNFCEVNIDECISSPCQHNATCVDLLHGYKCGFSGPRCEINVDECSSSPCFHGFCYDGKKHYDCVCQSGWEGKYCQREIDECLSLPCKNNATCTDLLDGHCPQNSHQIFNKCIKRSCLETAICPSTDSGDNELQMASKTNETINGSQHEKVSGDLGLIGEESQWCSFGLCPALTGDTQKCFCSPGWTGVDCAQDVNECDSGPCLNGARCTQSDIPGEFSCTCSPFFTGLLCDLPYDPCDSLHNPCLHDSTCLTRSNGTASCRCSAGERALCSSLIVSLL
uniref:EGF-like domain-containing protein n=1 Tax=Poecilia reticulata TaxID=8081 RepID=A0A3P9QGN3_POERE